MQVLLAVGLKQQVKQPDERVDLLLSIKLKQGQKNLNVLERYSMIFDEPVSRNNETKATCLLVNLLA